MNKLQKMYDMGRFSRLVIDEVIFYVNNLGTQISIGTDELAFFKIIFKEVN